MTVDELKARRKELFAKKKALELDGGDAVALCMVEEELLDTRAHLRALMPSGRIGSKGVCAQVGYASDLKQFKDWAQEDQDSSDENVPDVRTIAMSALANGKDMMPARQWEVLQLWSSGMSVTAIAEKLGVNKATASRILGRARRALNDVVDLQVAAPGRGGIRQDAVMPIDMSQEAVLKVVLPTLTETQIVYLYLYYGEFLSCAEIARLLEYDKSTVSRTLHRAVERITRAFHATRVQLTGLHALGELAYQFYVANHDLDKLPEAPTITQPYWGRSTLIQQFHVIPEVLQSTEDAPSPTDPPPAQTELVHETRQGMLRPLKPPIIVSLELFEERPQGGPRFGKLLSTLLERRRVWKIKQPVIFDWLRRIFGSFVGWLGKKR